LAGQPGGTICQACALVIFSLCVDQKRNRSCRTNAVVVEE
jgi:hypothetical protein